MERYLKSNLNWRYLLEKNFKDMLERFELELNRIFKKTVKELIIHGSNVDGGFVKGKGDIDFLVLIEHELTDEMFYNIKEYHRNIRLKDDLENQLEGCYLVINEFGQFDKKGIYIGTVEKGWRRFEGDIFSEIDKAHITESHYEHKQSGITKHLFPYEWEAVNVDLRSQLKENVEMISKYTDWDFRLHLLHTTARCLYSLEHKSFISKIKALEWLGTKTEFIEHQEYLYKIKGYKSILSEKEIMELDKLGYEELVNIVLRGVTYQ